MIGSGLKVTCSREEFVGRLGVVARAVSSRSSVQILAGVLLEAADGGLRLAATDMELSLRTSLEAQVESDGSVVVPGRLLVDIARLLPDAEVQLEHRVEEGVLGVTCGTASYRLHTYSAEDFPRLPDVDDSQLFTVDAEALLETVAQVSRSASRDESRPVLTGILARFEPGKLIMAATDSYRLAVKETDLAGSSQELEAIIPARALSELARIVGSRDTARARRAGEPGRVPDRRRGAHDAPHRRPVPEREAAASGAVRARGDDAARRAARGRPPRLGDGAAQHAAAAALRRRRAEHLRADAGRRARRRSRCRRRSPATRSRSGSTRSSCATGSSRCRPTRCS